MLPQATQTSQTAYAADVEAGETEASETEGGETDKSEADESEADESETDESETNESEINESETDEVTVTDSNSANGGVSDQAEEFCIQAEADEGDVTVQAAAASEENSLSLSATPSLTAIEGTALTTGGGSLDSGSYYLAADVTLKTDITIASGKTVTIDLNGHKLTGTGTSSVITVEGELTLTDSSTDGTGKVTGGSNTYGGVYVNNGTFTVFNTPVISGNTQTGGAANNVYLPSGKYITLSSPLTSGASVGVTTQAAPTESTAVEITTAEVGTTYYNNSLNHFFSDNTDYYVSANSTGNYLELGLCTALTVSDFNVNTDSVTYTGSAIEKTITSPTGLVKDTDYTVIYSANKNAGTAIITITGIGAYSGELTYDFTIKPITLNAVISGTTTKTYDATTDVTDEQSLSIALSGIVTGDTVTASAASYAYDSKNVGENKTITASGISLGDTSASNYTLSATTVTANVGTISKKTVTVSISGTTTKTYDGNTTVTDGDLSITLDGVVVGDTVNATASYAYADANAGEDKTITASDITLTGGDAGNYTLQSGSATITGSITTRTLSTADFTVDTEHETYTGSAITKTISSDLVEDTDYAVSYRNNTNAGTATITVTGQGNCTGSVSYDFIIKEAAPTVSLSNKTTTYTGNAIETDGATVSLVNNETYGGEISYTYYTDAECTKMTGTSNGASGEGAAPVNAGTYYVEASIAAQGNYAAASAVAMLVIEKAGAGLSVDTTIDKTYGDESFALNAVWTDNTAAVSYLSSNTNVATVDESGRVTIVGAGEATITVSVGETTNYKSGSVDITLTVAKENSSLIVEKAVYEITYGESFTASVDSEGGTVDFASSDTGVVTVDSSGVINSTGVGEATITASIDENDNYKASSISFSVKVNKAQPSIVLTNQETVYTGSAASVDATVTLVNGEIYGGTVTYTWFTDSSCTTVTNTADGSGASDEGAAPVNVGTYYVKASIEAQDNYLPAESEAAMVTINPKTVQLSWSTLSDSELVYDGNAKILSASVANKAQDSDDVSVTVALAGDGDNVNVTDEGFYYTASGLTGADSANYQLPSNVNSIVCKITAASLSTGDFVVTQIDGGTTVTLDTDGNASINFTGSAIRPTASVADGSLVSESDYEVAYGENTAVGTGWQPDHCGKYMEYFLEYGNLRTVL